MPQKKTVSIFRTNLVTIGIGQGQIKTLPYLFSKNEFSRSGETISQSTFTSEGLLAEKIAWDYDGQGRITCQYYFTEPDEPSEVISYERNEKGIVIKDEKKYFDGSIDITTYHYDEKNRLLEKITKDEDGVTDVVEKFTWDEKYLLKHEITDGENNVISLDEFGYDQKGNIVEHLLINEETGENQKTVSGFDEANRKINDKVYNEDDELLENTAYEYDASGRLISSEYQSPAKMSSTSYSYSEPGNLLVQEETDDNGNQLLWIEHTYDDQNNRIRSTVFANGGSLYNSQHYELNYEYEWFED